MELCMNSRMTDFSPSVRQMRRLGAGKFSDAEVMGKKLHCFRQRGQQAKKQSAVKMSIFTTDVGAEVKFRDLEMEKRDPRTVVAVILVGGAGTRLFPLTK